MGHGQAVGAMWHAAGRLQNRQAALVFGSGRHSLSLSLKTSYLCLSQKSLNICLFSNPKTAGMACSRHLWHRRVISGDSLGRKSFYHLHLLIQDSPIWNII